MLSLANDTPLKIGRERLVFRHPLSPNQLIKIVNPAYVSLQNGHWLHHLISPRISFYWLYLKELTEHIVLRAKLIQSKHHLQQFVGLVDTDMGLGLVVEAVTRLNGELAFTLGDLLKQGFFKEKEEAALVELYTWLECSPLIIRDLHADNVVWNEHGGHFVIIDGIGEGAQLSLRAIWPRFNAYYNRRKVKKLKMRVARIKSVSS